jgi:hypothetical protein
VQWLGGDLPDRADERSAEVSCRHYKGVFSIESGANNGPDCYAQLQTVCGSLLEELQPAVRAQGGIALCQAPGVGCILARTGFRAEKIPAGHSGRERSSSCSANVHI